MQKLSEESLKKYLSIIEQGDPFLQGMHALLEQENLELKSDFFAQLDKLIAEAQNNNERQALVEVKKKFLELQEQERLARKQEENELAQLESDFDMF